MPVDRVSTTPPYYEYIIGSALVPVAGTLSPNLVALTTGRFSWIEIPHYQRGISWGVREVEEFLASNSVLLGNVILSQFPISDRFPSIPNRYQNYEVLVDGLQRLAVGTILLNTLHSLVLLPSPERPGDAASFTSLAVRVRDFAPVYQHNDTEFRNHTRQAIVDQYKTLAEGMESYIRDLLSSGATQRLADMVVNTFLNKQIAIDRYINFTSPLELMNTFLGLNTVRVDLGPVDLLRANLVERATAASWRREEIEDMENEFTDVFTENEKPYAELLPFVAVVLDAVKSPTLSERVFRTWSSGLSKSEVDNFLSFVREFRDCREVNGYFDEIRSCGSIPFATLLVYYYCQYLHAAMPKPSFLTGGDAENAELHKFLVANYRVLLDGRIGRTRVYTERILAGYIQSLEIAADQISNQFVRRDVSTDVDRTWLRASLNKTDKQRAKRVFNAMLLPERGDRWGSMPFAPHIYGTKAREINVDHLIPESMKIPNSPGDSEVNSLRNFPPSTLKSE